MVTVATTRRPFLRHERSDNVDFVTVQAPRRVFTPLGVALSVAVAFLVSGVVDTLIALAARSLGADVNVVRGLSPPIYLAFALVGLLFAALAWSLVRAKARRPQGVMRVLVPVVVVVSLVPDILLGVLASGGWIGPVALMLMHLSVAVCGVLAFRRFLPLTP